jgi:hypothetical protein
MANLPRNGIRDWDQKQKVVCALLGVFTNGEMFAKVLEGTGTQIEISSKVSDLKENVSKWKTSTPLQYSDVLTEIVKKLNCTRGTTASVFVTSSIAEFIKTLPEDSRAMALDVVGLQMMGTAEIMPHSSTHVAGPSPRVIQLHHTDEMYSMAAGVRSGNLDTRHYYSTADAAETWERLVSADAYRGYDECKAGLRALVATDEWKKLLKEAPPTVAVMLGGGGSPTKDLVLARSLLEHASASRAHVTIVLVDINPYMLIQSANFLRRAKRDLPDQDRIEFEYAKADILRLGTTLHPIFNRNGPALFAITGGTIGNLSERMFFHSLNQIAQTGDLLIISADTVDDISADRLKSELAEKYDHPDMQQMIRPGVVAVLSELHIEEPVDTALKRVKVNVTSNSVAKLSDVSNSWNVTLNLTAGDRNITLVRSTRYSGDSLVKFAAQFNWESVCSIHSPENSHFMQFAFRRK